MDNLSLLSAVMVTVWIIGVLLYVAIVVTKSILEKATKWKP